jgi:hypothetical protein
MPQALARSLREVTTQGPDTVYELRPRRDGG